MMPMPTARDLLRWPDQSARAARLRALLALAWSFAMLATPLVGSAQDDRAPVLIDGREVFRVGPIDDVDASERARLIQRRIDLLLASPDEVAPSRVERPGPAGERQVSVAGVPIVTVGAADAADNVTTIDALAAAWAADLDRELARAADRRQTTVARFIAEIRAAFAAAFVRLYGTTASFVPRLLAAVMVLALFGVAARIVRWLLGVGFSRAAIDPTVENLVRSLAGFSVWGFGALAAMAALGFDPQTVVTGLGLTSLALGFGLRDVVSNYVSGVLILVLRPFELDDWIAIGDTEGTVEQIDLRATKIRTFDGALVLIPNGDVFTSRIVKNTEPVRRTSIPVALSPDADLDRAVAVAVRAAAAVPGVLAEPAPTARASDLRPDAAVIDIRYWTNTDHTDAAVAEDAARRAVVDALRSAGVALPVHGVRVVVPEQPPGPAGGAAS